ncbi:hypothetical protein L914_00239 [Phytophthora nicotianae]|uniref:Uncharacterized protein n=2 Tax=Phytophthora nicotianae TaxID=4792 RepID=V9G241_PHYNI|nr:hypothetical protein F443_00274 [Phytophthora nicotianae P1569]ETM56853.1 hypothetical protein L914_00239 [Phytophthora nicotianae]
MTTSHETNNKRVRRDKVELEQLQLARDEAGAASVGSRRSWRSFKRSTASENVMKDALRIESSLTPMTPRAIG